MAKSSVSKSKKKAWTEFSRFIRTRDCLKTTGSTESGRCCTCGKLYPFSRLQAGHFVPGRRNAGLFDERGVHAQCYACNVGLHGNWPKYLRFMEAEYGQDVIDELIDLRHVTLKFTAEDLDERAREYRERTRELVDGAYV